MHDHVCIVGCRWLQSCLPGIANEWTTGKTGRRPPWVLNLDYLFICGGHIAASYRQKNTGLTKTSAPSANQPLYERPSTASLITSNRPPTSKSPCCRTHLTDYLEFVGIEPLGPRSHMIVCDKRRSALTIMSSETDCRFVL